MKSIGRDAFRDCSISNVYISDIAAWCKIDIASAIANLHATLYLNGEKITNLDIPEGVEKIGNLAFCGFDNLTSVTIPNSVTSIGISAFNGCTGLTSVTIPNSVTSIEGYAFSGCTGLTSVTIGSSVTVIDDTFYGCTGLTSVTIGSSVTEIEASSFGGCNSLSKIVSYAVNPPIFWGSYSGEHFIEVIKETCVLQVPTGCKEAYQAAHRWKDFLNIEEVDFKFLVTYLVDDEVYATDSLIYRSNFELKEAPTKEGYTFGGWENLPETMPAQDIAVLGSFTVNSYTLIYMVDGEEYKRVEVPYGEAIEAEAIPTKEGYLFSGWSEIPETMPAHDVTVTGSFNADGIEDISTETLVDVYTLQGVKVKEQIPMKSLNDELPRGIYIVNGKKVVVR